MYLYHIQEHCNTTLQDLNLIHIYMKKKHIVWHSYKRNMKKVEERVGGS